VLIYLRHIHCAACVVVALHLWQACVLVVSRTVRPTMSDLFVFSVKMRCGLDATRSLILRENKLVTEAAHLQMMNRVQGLALVALVRWVAGPFLTDRLGLGKANQVDGTRQHARAHFSVGVLEATCTQ
jgi:hypothetical protein